jgi:hypothetical protein
MLLRGKTGGRATYGAGIWSLYHLLRRPPPNTRAGDAQLAQRQWLSACATGGTSRAGRSPARTRRET